MCPSLKRLNKNIKQTRNSFQIYGAVFGGHLSAFPSDLRQFGGPVLEATISLHRAVCAKFLPTPVKFYYGFNLRDLSCLVQVNTRHLTSKYMSPSCAAPLRRSRVLHPRSPICLHLFVLVMFTVPRGCAWQDPKPACLGTG